MEKAQSRSSRKGGGGGSGRNPFLVFTIFFGRMGFCETKRNVECSGGGEKELQPCPATATPALAARCWRIHRGSGGSGLPEAARHSDHSAGETASLYGAGTLVPGGISSCNWMRTGTMAEHNTLTASDNTKLSPRRIHQVGGYLYSKRYLLHTVL